jgi:Secretion system C-terminal sorting domain
MGRYFTIGFILFSLNLYGQWIPFAQIETSTTNGFPYLLDIEVFQGELYILGKFDKVDGVQVYNIAKYNGTNWVSLPITIIYPIDLEVYENDLYILGYTGNFGTGVTDDEYITKWDGTTWSVLLDSAFLDTPPDMPDPRKMEVYDGKLFIGGDNLLLNGIQGLKSLAIWNGLNFENDSFQINGTIVDLESNSESLGLSGQFSVNGSNIGFFAILKDQNITPLYPVTLSISANAIIHSPSFTALAISGENIFKNGSWTSKNLKGKDDSHLFIKSKLVYGNFGEIFQIDTITLNNESIIGDSLNFLSVKFVVFNNKLIAGPSNPKPINIANIMSLDTTGIISDIKTPISELVKLYPNPNNGVLFIEGIRQETELTIYKIDGRIVQTDREWLGNYFRVSINNVMPGFYIVKCKNPNVFKKIIVY